MEVTDQKAVRALWNKADDVPGRSYKNINSLRIKHLDAGRVQCCRCYRKMTSLDIPTHMVDHNCTDVVFVNEETANGRN